MPSILKVKFLEFWIAEDTVDLLTGVIGQFETITCGVVAVGNSK